MVYGPIVPTSCRHAALPAFSFSFYLAPRVFVPLPLEISLVLTPLLLLFHSYSPLSLWYSCRPFHVHGTLSLYLASFHESRTLFMPLPAPRLSCGQRAKAGNSDSGSKSILVGERERERVRGGREGGRKPIPERDSDITEHEKRTETTNSPTYTCARSTLYV